MLQDASSICNHHPNRQQGRWCCDIYSKSILQLEADDDPSSMSLLLTRCDSAFACSRQQFKKISRGGRSCFVARIQWVWHRQLQIRSVESSLWYHHILPYTAWCFGTWFLFFPKVGMMIQSDFHSIIFQGGWLKPPTSIDPYIWEIITTSLRPHWKSWLIMEIIPKWP